MSRYAIRLRADRAGLWPGRGPRLRHLDIELTESCDNRCVHCYIRRPGRIAGEAGGDLSAGRIEKALVEAAELGCLSVRYTGGEPLLRPDFGRLYLFARRLGLRVILFTNAIRLAPATADLLASVPPLEPVEITVYGMTPKTYEAVTGVRGSFAAARAGIERLAERGVALALKWARLPANIAELEAFEAWAAGLGSGGRPAAVTVLPLLHGRRNAARNRAIARQRPDPEAAAEFLTLRLVRDGAPLGEFLGGYTGTISDRLFDCGAGLDSCALDARGLLQPCLLVRHPAAVVDLGRGGLRAALDDFFPALRERRASDPAYLARCARCVLRGLCEQCPGIAWMESGTLDAPAEYFCRTAHAQARRLGLLGQAEPGWTVEDWPVRVAALSRGAAAGSGRRGREAFGRKRRSS